MKISFLSLPAAALCTCGLLLSQTASRASITVTPEVTGGAAPFSAEYGLIKAVDGDSGDYASQNQGANTFLEFTFPAPQTVNRVVVINRDSPDGSDWIGNFTLTFGGGATASVLRTPGRGLSQIHSLGGSFTASTVRLDADTTGGGTTGNTGATEVIFLNSSAGLTVISGVTIAGGAPAFSADYAAANAVDGIVGRTTGAGITPEYASASLGNGAFLDFDLGSVRPVGGFDLFDRPAGADRVTGYDMIFSTDSTFGNGDDTVKSFTNSRMATGAEFDPVSARYVRFDVTANAGANPATANTGMSEIIFYQTIPEPSAALFLLLSLGGCSLRRRRMA